MKIVTDLSKISKDENPVVALGNFDGLHLGHQEVIKTAVKAAKESRKKSAVLTFSPNPRRFFKPEGFYEICDKNLKYQLIEKMGVDYLYEIHFDEKFASISPKEFVEKVLIDRINLSHLVTGYNFHFGKNKEGDSTMMKELSESRFIYSVIRQVTVESYQVSSTLIRSLVSGGRVNVASQLLGRLFSVEGAIVKGKAMAKNVLGFATANINIAKEQLRPMHGVYFVRVEFDDKQKFGVANFGIRPSVDNGAEVLEVHILDFDADIYNKNICVEFITFMRPEVKFKDLEALKYQIRKDVTDANYLQRNIKRLTSL